MLICMQSTSVRIYVASHDELQRLAAEFDTTVGNTVALAVRAFARTASEHQLQGGSARRLRPSGSMQTSGDLVSLDFGRPERREAGYVHPAVVVTAQRILDAAPTVIQVVPLTSTLRGFHSEIVIEPDIANGLELTFCGAMPASASSVAGAGREHVRKCGAASLVSDSRDDRCDPRPAVISAVELTEGARSGR